MYNNIEFLNGQQFSWSKAIIWLGYVFIDIIQFGQISLIFPANSIALLDRLAIHMLLWVSLNSIAFSLYLYHT